MITITMPEWVTWMLAAMAVLWCVGLVLGLIIEWLDYRQAEEQRRRRALMTAKERFADEYRDCPTDYGKIFDEASKP